MNGYRDQRSNPLNHNTMKAIGKRIIEVVYAQAHEHIWEHICVGVHEEVFGQVYSPILILLNLKS